MNAPRLPRRRFVQSLTLGVTAANVLGCKSTAGGAPPGAAGNPGAAGGPSAGASPALAAASSFQGADGQSYAPTAKPNPVVKPGEFVFAAAHLDHGHIYGQCNGLKEAGATLAWVYDPDPEKVAKFRERFPEARVASSLDEILKDASVKLLATAAVPNQRGPIGCRAMQAGKDYFTDKPPFTTLGQLEEARRVAAETKRKFMVYYSERLHNESAMYATDLVARGAIGRVLQVIGLGPHREGQGRPDWFYDPEKYGGILCDIGSHQFEQFLTYTGATDAQVQHAAVANYAHPQHPAFQDFGEAALLGNNGATNYVRVDWFTPRGLGVWGDGRTLILGDQGTIELRKYIDVARDKSGNHVYLVDQAGEHHFEVDGKVGFRFFGELILDCIHRTEKAMTQGHAFKAAELCLRAQADAKRVG